MEIVIMQGGMASDLELSRCTAAAIRVVTCGVALEPYRPGRRVLWVVSSEPAGAGRRLTLS